MSFILTHWCVLAVMGVCLAAIGLYQLGKSDSYLDAIADQRAIGRLEGKLDYINENQDRARTERKKQYERQEVTDQHIE